jgi:hypothetical protein
MPSTAARHESGMTDMTSRCGSHAALCQAATLLFQQAGPLQALCQDREWMVQHGEQSNSDNATSLSGGQAPWVHLIGTAVFVRLSSSVHQVYYPTFSHQVPVQRPFSLRAS